MDTKKQIIKFLKVLAAFLAAFVAIVPNVEIWNLAAAGQTDAFHVTISVINLLFEFAMGFFFFRDVVKIKDKED